MSTYPAIPDIPMGESGGGDAKICGDANPTHYIEPNVDGSINAVLVQGTLSLSPTVELGAGSEVIGHVITDTSSVVALGAGTEVIGHVIVDTGSEVTLTSGATVGLAAGTEVVGHVITDTGSTTALDAGTTVGLVAGTAQIGHVITDPTSTTTLAASTEVIGHVIVDTGSEVTLTTGAVVDLASGAKVDLASGAKVALEGGTTIIGVVLPANASVGVPLGTVENTGPQVVHAGSSYASGAIVTTAGGGAALSFYNHASDASGTIVGFIPAAATAGSYWPFNMPASVGIVAGVVDTSPAVTIAYSFNPTS